MKKGLRYKSELHTHKRPPGAPPKSYMNRNKITNLKAKAKVIPAKNVRMNIVARI